ncbi:MAG: hypothetical protein ACYCXO_07510 [Candidatus Humimicrobiaceae bacterium]
MNGEVKMYKIKAINIAYIIMVIIVFILVMTAVLTNLDKFLSKETIKYTQINIENGIRVDDLISKYSTQENKENFIAEVKKINKIENLDHIDKKSLIIPVTKPE